MIFDLKYYMSIFWRRSPYFLVVASVISVIGLSIAIILPSTYRADALLLVEGEQIPDELAASTVTTGSAEQLQIIERRLFARPSLLELATRLNIYPNRSQMDPSVLVADMRQRLEIRRQQSAGRGGATTVVVAFTAGSGSKAAEVTNEMVTLILQENLELRRGRAAQTLEFFDQEVTRLNDELATQSATILAFKLANQNSLPDSLEYSRSRQTSQQERLLQLQRTEAGLADRRARLIELYERTGRVDMGQVNLTPDQRQLQALESELGNALLVYSDTNPRIRVLKQRVAALQAAVAAQGGTNEGADQALSLYEMQLSEIDGELGYISDQKVAIEANLALLKEQIEATPKNSISMDELEREYSITQGQYNAAVGRLSAARVGDRIEALARGQRISVIEQASAPTEPTSPNRPLIAAGSIGSGIGLGLAVIFLMEFLNRSIRRPIEIERKLGILPLATLPYMRTTREHLIRCSIITSVLGITVLGIPIGLWMAHTYYLPMDLLVERAIDQIGLGTLVEQILQRQTP